MTLDGSYFQGRLDELGTRKKALDSESVTYRRTGIGSSFSIDATFAKANVQELQNVGHLITEEQNESIIVTQVDLEAQLGAGAVPKPEDIIIRSSPSETYNVVERDGEVWRYTTSSQARVRVNLERVS